MFSAKSIAAFAACFSTLVARAQAGDVYAHFIVGVAGGYTQDDWNKDVAAAAASKIDGFALNIGGDSYTDTQLGFAYKAAEAHGNFKMFISFDYAANPAFSAGQVSGMINKYKTSPAQAKYQNKPIASTFEGPDKAGDWPGIKANTGCAFIPDWTSKKGDAGAFAVTDGALSWDLWPTTSDMTDANDKAWRSVLGSKAYMMGISPWFYTDLPQYNKNWVFRGSNLWWDRWQQAIEIQPELIEIVTWNDFGESHYIGPITPKAVVKGSERYVNSNPHDGWRALLPYYIEAYKSGNKTSTPSQDVLSWAHQPNPLGSCSDGGVQGGQGAPIPVSQVVENSIDVDMMLTAPAQLSVQIGGAQPVTRQMGSGLQHASIPFGKSTGQVTYTLSRGGKTVLTVKGTEISASCSQMNFNAVTGSSLNGGSVSNVAAAAPAPASSSSSTASTPKSAAAAGNATQSDDSGDSDADSSDAPAAPAASPAPAASSPAPASSSPTAPKASTGGSGSCNVEFDAKQVTKWGENVFVAGSVDSLGNFDTSKALALKADQYTAANPLWTGSTGVPAGAKVQYRYFKKEEDGSIVWENGQKRTMTVPSTCSGTVKQADTVS